MNDVDSLRLLLECVNSRVCLGEKGGFPDVYLLSCWHVICILYLGSVLILVFDNLVYNTASKINIFSVHSPHLYPLVGHIKTLLQLSMSSRGRSREPKTPSVNTAFTQNSLLSRGRSIPRAHSIYNQKVLQMASESRSRPSRAVSVHGNKPIYSEHNSKAGLFPENTVNNALVNKTKGIQFKSSGRVGTGAGVFTQVLESSVPHESQANDSVLDDSLSDVQMLYRNSVSDNEDYSSDDDIESLEKRSNKKMQQWKKWTEVIIPAMLQPYMALMHETNSLRNIENCRKSSFCNGCNNGRMLNVVCVYFNSKLHFWDIMHVITIFINSRN